MSKIVLESVTKAFGENQVLDGITLTVEPGESVAMIGQSGSGKSVMLKRILGLIQSLGFDLCANEMLHAGNDDALIVLEGLEEFREHLGGELAITLLKGIGRGFEVNEISLPKMIEAIYELKDRHAQAAPKMTRLLG